MATVLAAAGNVLDINWLLPTIMNYHTRANLIDKFWGQYFMSALLGLHSLVSRHLATDIISYVGINKPLVALSLHSGLHKAQHCPDRL